MNKFGFEARILWIESRTDQLMDDMVWVMNHEDFYSNAQLRVKAREQAEREHAKIMADLEDERINAYRED